MAVLKEDSDRRGATRRSLDKIQTVLAVKLHSQEVEVVNASRSGVLIECGLRLPPGAVSQLEIVRPDQVIRVRGRVVRCEVKRISAERVEYQVAIALNQDLDFIDDGRTDDVESTEASDASATPETTATPTVAAIVAEALIESGFASW